MEPDVAASLVKEIESNNVLVNVMTMDEDCTTLSKISNSLSHPVTKWSDLNHTKKHVENNLHNLQKKT